MEQRMEARLTAMAVWMELTEASYWEFENVYHGLSIGLQKFGVIQ
jgi:hypothetical protein